MAGQIHDVCAGWHVGRTHELDFAIGEMDVGNPIDSLIRVDDMRALEDQRIRGGTHASAPIRLI